MPSSIIPDVGFRFADKTLHFVMYAGLGVLLARAMDDPAQTTLARAVIGAVLLCVAIGALDEWHQTFIQGRSTELADWLADSLGGLVGATAWTRLGQKPAFRAT